MNHEGKRETKGFFKNYYFLLVVSDKGPLTDSLLCFIYLFICK